MKRLIILFCLFALCPICNYTANGQSETGQNDKLLSVSGKIIDAESRDPLVFASISMLKNAISIISNGEGKFSIKFPANAAVDSVCFSFIGYQPATYAVEDLLKESKSIVIPLTMSPIRLAESIVKPEDALSLVLRSIDNINNNYPLEPMQMTSFYREMIKKGNNYVTLTEAVVDINKMPYDRQFSSDAATIYKGRGSIDWKKVDTVFVKIRGGITSSLALDIMKDPFIGVYPEDIKTSYNFYIDEKSVMIEGEEQYVINFQPKPNQDFILFRGKLYIERATLALTRADFELNITDENRAKATSLFILRKPKELKTTMEYAKYLVQYKKFNDKWVLDHTRSELQFEAKWSRKLFKNTYTIISEMAVTDKSFEIDRIASANRIKNRDFTMDKVSDFEDDEFWKDYNVIEPESDINNVIAKIARQLKRRSKN